MDLLNRVQQKRRRDAFEREVHLLEAGAANRELAPEVAGRCHARERLDRPQEVVHEAAQLLKDRAAQRAFGRNRGILSHRRRADHGDGFFVGAGAFGERDRDFRRRAGRHRDRSLHQNEIDHGHVQFLIAGGDAGELEAPLLVGDRHLPGRRQPNGHAVDRRAAAGVDDDAADDAGVSRRGGLRGCVRGGRDERDDDDRPDQADLSAAWQSTYRQQPLSSIENHRVPR